MKVILLLVFLVPSVYSYSIDENTDVGKLEKKEELSDEKLSFDYEDLGQDVEEESFDVDEDADENDNDDDEKGVVNI